MRLDTDKIRQTLRNFDFKTLFIDHLGWDRHSASHEITVDEKKFSLHAVAQKRGVIAFLCKSSVNGGIPDYQMRKRLERVVEKSHHEHLIVFADERAGSQIWQWVKRELGKPIANREHTYHRSQSGDALIQKLQSLAFSIEEEDILTIVDVAGRLRGFDVERVTKRFYDQFKTEHTSFTKFIQGIPDESLQSWYASFMIDRLMFIYFVQKKNFLDGDPDYLRTKLEQSRKRGANRYYKEFLCCLFFEGFAKKERERSPAIKQLLGKVPYLNGGLFLPHQIEERYGDRILIADTAFINLYDFFGQWHWHLDDRPLRNDREINPDVLGYIFEKYVNQKQMGAYYTKEDITEYIGKNTIIPFLFDAAEKKCPNAFINAPQNGESIWCLLRDDPDRYIYEAVKKGVRLSLPDNIAAGIVEVPKRGGWNKPAAEEHALPTEIWREVVARRQRYEEIYDKMLRGKIHSINDLITYNLNIRQFAQDVIASCDDPELLHAIYHTIEKLTLLDPTCGSGAFLFAALNILEPLYEACLARMEAFLAENASTNGRQSADPFNDFRQILARVDEHSNRRYFILKAIIVNNLFGVDIMEEAVEICKLRLFLKLAAQAEKDDSKPNLGIEPLPDIDFNIRVGNTLVGFATRQEVKDWITLELKTGQYKMRQMLSGDALERIEVKAKEVDDLFASFRQQQTEDNTNATPKQKEDLQDKLGELRNELNRYLAAEYGVSHNQSSAYDKWLKSHKPFHWFVEFYGVIKSGGFDVIIGNPPYVGYKKVMADYRVRNYRTEACSNLYAFMMERSLNLVRNDARCGLILPVASVSTGSMNALQKLYQQKATFQWYSHFATRPGKLFVGVDMNLTITLLKTSVATNGHCAFSTTYYRWRNSDEGDRESLFYRLNYRRLIIPSSHSNAFPKLGAKMETSVLEKLHSHQRKLKQFYNSRGVAIYYHSGGRYWRKALPDKLSSHYKEIKVDQRYSGVTICLLNSQLYYWYWIANSNCMDVVSREVDEMPVFDMIKANYSVFETLKSGLLAAYMAHRTLRTRQGDIIATDEFNFDVKECKPIIDEIDRVLAQHYGFTDEELDFILNYDIKYRMGSTEESE